MKRVLFIIPSLGGGGAEKVLVDILNRIDYNVYCIDLLVIHYYGPYISQINKNVNVIRVFNGSRSILWRLIAKVERFLSISDWVSKKRIKRIVNNLYDTIVSFTTNESLYYHSFIFDKAKSNVSWVHVDVMKNHSSYPFKSADDEIAAYDKIDKLVFVSKDAQNSFNLLFNTIRAPQRVIYNLIDKEAIKAKSLEFNIINEKLTIVSVGRLVPVKGYTRLIKVAKLLKEGGVKFHCQILGVGPQYKELDQLIKIENVSDVVSLLGYKNNPYPYIRAADIFVSTSLSEAFPLVVCESLCLGKAVICTRTTGPIELLQDRYGILTDHDENDIYQKIKALIESQELRETYQYMAKQRSEMFDPQLTMDAIYQVIN